MHQKVEIIPYKEIKKFPLVLRTNYQFYQMEIMNQVCILAIPKEKSAWQIKPCLKISFLAQEFLLTPLEREYYLKRALSNISMKSGISGLAELSIFTDQYVLIGSAACDLSFYNTVVFRVLWEAMRFREFINRKRKIYGIGRLCYDGTKDATHIFINLKGENRLT